MNKATDYDSLEKTVDDSAAQHSTLPNLDDKSSLDYPKHCNSSSNDIEELRDHEVGLLTSIQVERYDLIKGLAFRIKKSVSFLLLYIGQLIANMFVLIWEFSGSEDHIAVILIELLINLFFVVEILIEIVTQGRTEYFKNIWNRLDFTVCMFCIIFFVVFFVLRRLLTATQIFPATLTVS